MKTRKGLAEILGILLSLALAVDAFAETRTLTTVVTVTIRPAPPKVPEAPPSVEETFSKVFPTTTRERVAKAENLRRGDAVVPCYTLTEKM
jgi:hypothetical protein